MRRLLTLPPDVEQALGRFHYLARGRFGARIREVRLFGSYSRGEQRLDSDVDVLVVIRGITHAERRDVFDLATDLYFDTLVRIAPLALSDDEMDQLRRRECLIAREIDGDGIPLQPEGSP